MQVTEGAGSGLPTQCMSGGRGQLEPRKARSLVWSHTLPEEGAPFSAQRLCPPNNCRGDTFLNFTKATPAQALVVASELGRSTEMLNTSWIWPDSSVSGLDEGCERKRGIEGKHMDHGLGKWNNGFLLAEMGKMGMEGDGGGWKRCDGQHILSWMPSKYPSGDGPGNS